MIPQARHRAPYLPPPSADPYALPGKPPQAPLSGAFSTQKKAQSKDLWISSHAPGQTPERFIGDEILNALRSTGGGIAYWKRNNYQTFFYVDNIVIYTFNLVPLSLIPSNESEPHFTDIGKSWVIKEALDLFDYGYTQTPFGYFRIPGNLELVSNMRMDYYGTCNTNSAKERN